MREGETAVCTADSGVYSPVPTPLESSVLKCANVRSETLGDPLRTFSKVFEEICTAASQKKMQGN
eukprot:1837008-Prymnesium_polylepis.1